MEDKTNKCKICGAEIDPSYRFCPFCGGSQAESAADEICFLSRPAPKETIRFRTMQEVAGRVSDNSEFIRMKDGARTRSSGSAPGNQAASEKEVSPAETAKQEEPIRKMSREATIGNEVLFGGIRWRVLWVRGNRKLLLAQQSVAKMPLSSGDVVSWERSSLRKWLNSTFLKDNFSEEERRHVIPMEYVTRISGFAVINSVERTTDRVGVLSHKEFDVYVVQLLAEEEQREEAAAAKGKAKGRTEAKGAGESYFSCYKETGFVRNLVRRDKGPGTAESLRMKGAQRNWTTTELDRPANIYPVIWWGE